MHEKITEKNIKPCPICGIRAELNHVPHAGAYWVSCAGGGCLSMGISDNKEEAIKLWNSIRIEDEDDTRKNKENYN